MLRLEKQIRIWYVKVSIRTKYVLRISIFVAYLRFEMGKIRIAYFSLGYLDALPEHALGALDIVVVVRDVGPRQILMFPCSLSSLHPENFFLVRGGTSRKSSIRLGVGAKSAKIPTVSHPPSVGDWI